MADPTDKPATSSPVIVTRLRAERVRRGLSVRAVAEAVGYAPSNLSRLELGQQTPPRHVARALHSFFEGRVPLGDVYDPAFGPGGVDVAARLRAIADEIEQNG
jgi:transcriptional regulator with XRE-family HTH domain